MPSGAAGIDSGVDSGAEVWRDSGTDLGLGSWAGVDSVLMGTGGLRMASIGLTATTECLGVVSMVVTGVDCSGLTCATVTGRAGCSNLDSITVTAGCSGQT